MDVVEQHRRAGRFFEAAGVRSFVREAGKGEPVVCLHGVPTSSFMYRKVLHELASRSMRGIAFDLPGLGLADRPELFDYTWTGLGRWCGAAVDALELDRFHLVVHDIGGPVGFELATAMPERIQSLTLLNTMVDVDDFRRPWVMEPFAHRGLGELWLHLMTPFMFRMLMPAIGVHDMRRTRPEDVEAYVELLKREDGGKAFLRIMRGFELTTEKRRKYRSALRNVPYPVQIVWGGQDPALKVEVQGRQAKRAARLDKIERVPAKHFVPEERATAIATRVVALARAERSPKERREAARRAAARRASTA
jgi:haloalkane dehalogenase